MNLKLGGFLRHTTGEQYAFEKKERFLQKKVRTLMEAEE
jgi:hypothetical protein